jgi:hypothetical protein
MSIEKNEIAELLLREAGFHPEPEPAWVTSGEVPDFFCAAPCDLWVEVKAIDDTERFYMRAQQMQWFRERTSKITERGSAYALVSNVATQRHIKAAMALARDALRAGSAKPSSAGGLYAIVPNEPDFSARVHITIETRSGTELLVCFKSESGKYGRPILGDELEGDPIVVLAESDGKTTTARASDLGLHDDDFLVGLSLRSDDKPFEIEGVLPTGPARILTTTQTVRRAASKANSQFKNACRFRNAPCLLMVFEDGVLVQDPRAFASAFYGNLRVRWPSANDTDRKVVFEGDGVWGPQKNTTISAACLVRNDGHPIVIPNPWAALRIPAGIFGWLEGRICSDGRIELPA